MEIKKKQEELDKLTDISKMIERKEAAMKEYEEFLEKVKAQYPDEFTEMTDILNRYDTLKRTNNNLVSENQKLQEELDSLTNDIAVYEKDKTNEVLSLNNEIAELQKELEKTEEEKNRKQKGIEDKVKNNRIQNKQLSQIVMAINNLYWKCKEQRKGLQLRFESEGSELEPFSDSSKALEKAEKQLLTIGEFIKNYQGILDSLKEDKSGDAAKKGAIAGYTKQTHH